ncbi:extracellular catalytic domain type 2 short-chain-length polyhydroxyalkanoate depolymerase [Dokdonella soli]|uniref:PHB depolymerase family esterase n=1 Tax=Dokdonella soli TaxID=529810 RepID=A0ABN1IF93_9GAMM
MNRRHLPLALTFVVALGAHAAEAPLPKLTLDPAHTTVSGLSSGAYMAHQVHLAFSDHVAGAALIAGGPYHCAEGSLQTALATCMTPADGKGPDVAALAQHATAQAKAGKIAPLSGLAGDRVLILHGRADKTVAESLSADTASLYRTLAGTGAKPLQLREDLAREFTHTFPTVEAGAACDVATAPYVGKCGFDAAGAIFTELYGKPPHPVAAKAGGELRTFDQDAYRDPEADALMAAKGYLYVPKACAEAKRCALHIAFHGCQQNVDTVGEAFVRDAGYNRWADVYGVVVLYPQVRASMAPLNPKGCWDWWGYSGDGYDTRDGVQMRWLGRASAALGAPLR